MVTIKEFSAGAVVFRKVKGELKYLILCSHQNIWGFPKGHIEKGESEEQAALREVFEETGLKGKLVEGFCERTSYIFTLNKRTINKNVVFFLFEAETNSVKLSDVEHKNHKWFSYENTKKLLTHDDSKKILEKANKKIK